MGASSLPWFAAALGLAMAAAPGRAEAFTARFSWSGIPACEKISPAFDLGGVPAGTKRLRFEMTDLDVPTFYHGGSTIAYQSEAVRQGVIRYIGPCPPRGERHRYRWSIEALDASDRVLGRTETTQTFPP